MRFNPLIYALALAVIMSGSAPFPRAIRPFSFSRTVTSPCASVPPVMALTDADARESADKLAATGLVVSPVP